MKLLVLGGLCWGVLAFGVAGSALAVPTWLTASDLSTTVAEPSNPQVAVDSQGNALALWYGGGIANHGIEEVDRAAGSNWSGLAFVSPQGEFGIGPQVAVNASGDAVVVWALQVGSDFVVRTSAREAGGDWSAPVEVSKPAGGGTQTGSATLPQVAVNARGDAVVVWKLTDGTSSTIQAVVRLGSSGTWSDPAVVPNAGNVESPQVAIDDTGNAVAVWRSGKCGPDPNSDTNIQASVRQAGQEWGSPTYLSKTQPNDFCNDFPQLAVNGDGDAVVVWPHIVGDGKGHEIQAVTGSTGDETAWTKPDDIADLSAQDARDPQVSIDSGGNAVAVWWRYNAGTPSSFVVEAATHSTAGGDWGSPAQLSGAGSAYYPQAAVNGDGRAVAVWIEQGPSNFVVRAAVGSTAGSWSDSSDVSTVPEGVNVDALAPQVGVDDAGNAVAVWQRYDNDCDCAVGVSAAGLDAAGPQLNGLNIASLGTVGEPLSFSVSPLDVWSDTASTSWDFGDGTNATGESVTHTYSQPGKYNVQVSSTDTLGNTSTRSQSVVVSAAPSGGAPAPVSAAGPSPVTSTGTVALSRIKMRIRCVQGKRLVSCRRGKSARRRLEVSFDASAAAKVKIQVLQSQRRKRARIRPRMRTVMQLAANAVAGANRFSFPFKTHDARGRLTGTVSVEGGERPKSVPVRGG